MVNSPPIFHRTELAQRLAAQILANNVGASASSGLFLAAPRRTGKSTFMREDLRPALQSQKARVLYVDLWANKTSDPGLLIASAIKTELNTNANVVKRLAKKLGLSSLNVAGVAEFSLDSIQIGADISLSDALVELSDEIRQTIVLIIDEAQHAITTDQGYDALFALKAARDELNSSQHHGLRIVATGSNRDKLAMLRNSKDQAFFGAPLVAFPSLDDRFVKWFCDGVGLPAPLDPLSVMSLFEKASYRPEILGAAAEELRFDFTLVPELVGKRFESAVLNQIANAERETLRVINSLTPLQTAVLRVLAARQSDYAPFQEETMSAYKAVLAQVAPNETLEPDGSNVQQALVALQTKTLIWKETRGVYAIEEAATIDLMRNEGMLDGVPEIRTGRSDRQRG